MLVLVEVLQRKSFPSIKCFLNYSANLKVFHDVPFRILARALPNLEALHLNEHYILGKSQLEMSDVFDGFAGGMFAKVERIEIGSTAGHTQGEIVSKLTSALRAGEYEDKGEYEDMFPIDKSPF